MKSRFWLNALALILFAVFCIDSAGVYFHKEEMLKEEGEYALQAVQGSFPDAAIRTFSYKGRKTSGREAMDFYRVEAAVKNRHPLVLIVEVTVNPQTSEPKRAHVKKL
ncbi:hypothetical protein J9317_04795 [Metabacillus sp. KIGAM252]|uniref:DUF3889 domain-containing protein n=1 Tax=Metabacillus flavus TaxID=2823519 RepID=A0ABS5LBH3_9BACI|nr:hypothetical protein [Metabacillus flavus]MBS2968072.1 hypothetical protein [Metabacillus flavus]